MGDLVYIDTETRSHEPLKNGLKRYFAKAELLMVQWAVGNGPVHVWDAYSNPRQPEQLANDLSRPHATFVAHNAPFDHEALEDLLLFFTDCDRWVCTRAQAYSAQLPGALDTLCEALGVPQEYAKIKDGKRLIQLFCKPHKGVYNRPEDYPDDWQKFKDYGARDIDSLRAVHRRLPTCNFQAANLRYFWLDAAANRRGFPIDLPLVEAAVDLLERAKSRGDADISDRTGGVVTAITQRDRLLKYLESTGLNLPNMRRGELEEQLARDDLSPEHRFILEARLEGARASGHKYKAALKQHLDGRIYYSTQCFGAGATGRDAHKGFQPGNMPRAVTFNPIAEKLSEQHVPASAEFIDACVLPGVRDGSALDTSYLFGGPNTAVALACRHALLASSGHEFVVADFKNIESVVLAWIAGADQELSDFRAAFGGTKLDAYRLLYHRFFGTPLDRITDHERQAGKVIKLACGFGGSVGAVVTMSVTYGLDLSTLPALIWPNATDKQKAKAEQVWSRAFVAMADYGLEPDAFKAVHVLVQMFRASNPEVDAVKRAIGRAVEAAVRIRGSVHDVARCTIWCDENVLTIQLPSGRRLFYWSPKLESELVYDPEEGTTEERVYITYLRWRGRNPKRERAWPGLFLENIVQAIANDLLRVGCLEVDRRWPGCIVLKIHDEIVAEAKKGLIVLKDFMAAMCVGAAWSAGMPLAASGWIGERYGKRDK